MNKRTMILIITMSFLFIASVIVMCFAYAGVEPSLFKAQKPKDKFWDLEAVRIVVNGKTLIPNQENKVYAKVLDTLHLKFYYRIKTPNIGDITEADAKYWGNGKHTYEFGFGWPVTDPGHEWVGNKHSFSKESKGLKIPGFTYEDVQNWQKRMGSSVPKIWTKTYEYSLTVKPAWIGKRINLNFGLSLNPHNRNEVDRNNNGLITFLFLRSQDQGIGKKQIPAKVK